MRDRKTTKRQIHKGAGTMKSMDILADKNPHKRDDDAKKKKFNSVTTITSFYYPYFNNTKDKSKKITEAMKNGTKIHKDIENYYAKGIINNDSKEFGLFQQFIKDHDYLVPYRTEWLVYDEKIKLSGTIDMVYKNKDDSYSIYDWKCTNYLNDNDKRRYSLQLNLYKKIIESNYGLKIKHLFLLQLNSKEYRIIEIDDKVMTDSKLHGLNNNPDFISYVQNNRKIKVYSPDAEYDNRRSRLSLHPASGPSGSFNPVGCPGAPIGRAIELNDDKGPSTFTINNYKKTDSEETITDEYNTDDSTYKFYSFNKGKKRDRTKKYRKKKNTGQNRAMAMILKRSRNGEPIKKEVTALVKDVIVKNNYSINGINQTIRKGDGKYVNNITT